MNNSKKNSSIKRKLSQKKNENQITLTRIDEGLNSQSNY